MAASNPKGAELPKNQDNLQEIKGIGPDYAAALYEAGILRYSDLAKYTTEKLVDLLRPKFPRINAGFIKRWKWIEQARELASRQAEEALVEVPEKDPVAPEADLPSDKPAGGNAGPNPGNEGWKDVGAFMVLFYEKVDPGGELQRKIVATNNFNEKSSPDYQLNETGEMVKWMFSQSNLPFPEEPAPEEPAAEKPAEQAVESLAERPSAAVREVVEDIQPVLSDVWVSQVYPAGVHPEKAEKSWVRVEAQINFFLPEEAEHPGTARQPELTEANRRAAPESFSVDILLTNLATKKSTFIETPSAQFSPETLPHKFLFDFPLPPIGRYQLYLVARLAPPRKTYAIQRGPVILVER